MGAFLEGVFDSKEGTAAALQSAGDLLVSLSGMLEPDGGMPGKKHEIRIVNSLAALLSLYKHGTRRPQTRSACTWRSWCSS